MRRVLQAIAMLVLAGPAWAQAPAGPPQREATVANDTDRTLQQLYIYRPGAQEEGPDRLGANTLPPRASLRVSLGRTRDCGFEAKAVFEDGDELRQRFNLCRNPRVAFTDTGPRREVEVVNQTDEVLRELYLSPPGSGERGRDRLGSHTVAVGETFRLRLRGTQECLFDIRAVFADDQEETRTRQDLCRSPRLAFGDPAAPQREAVVTNRGRRTLRELYARPAGREGWGSDRLGSEMLEPQGEFHLRLRAAGCAFDLRAVFDNDREEVLGNRNLCTGQVIAFGQAAGGGERREITLRNGFARTVQEVYLSPAESDEWGEDALGDGVLPPGGQQAVAMEGGCQADLRIVFDTQAAEERRGIDICATRTIALRPGWTIDDRLAPAPEPAAVPAVKPEPAPAAAPAPALAPQPAPAEATTPAPAAQPAASGSIRLRNAAAVPVVGLYADPPGASRGAERLGQAAMAAGESRNFAPPEDLALAGTACQADLTVVFGDGRELRLPETDLCTGQELVLQ